MFAVHTERSVGLISSTFCKHEVPGETSVEGESGPGLSTIHPDLMRRLDHKSIACSLQLSPQQALETGLINHIPFSRCALKIPWPLLAVTHCCLHIRVDGVPLYNTEAFLKGNGNLSTQ